MKQHTQKTIKMIAILCIMIMIIAGCRAGQMGQEEKENEINKLKIMTTIYPIHHFTKQIVGEYAEVTSLIPIGAEPHGWEPSAKEMKQLEESNVFIYNGLGLEGWAEKTLASIRNPHLIAVNTGEAVDIAELKDVADEHDHDHDGHDHDEDEQAHETDDHGLHEHRGIDPHIWLNPQHAGTQVRAILQALIEADAAHADIYTNNAETFLQQLEDLDQKYEETLKNTKHRYFITQHAAFGHLAKRYNLKQVAISGLSSDADPSPTRMKQIIELAKEYEVKTILFETLVSPRVAEALAREIGANTDVLNPLEGLTKEELEEGKTYIGIMEENLAVLEKVLNE